MTHRHGKTKRFCDRCKHFFVKGKTNFYYNAKNMPFTTTGWSLCEQCAKETGANLRGH